MYNPEVIETIEKRNGWRIALFIANVVITLGSISAFFSIIIFHEELARAEFSLDKAFIILVITFNIYKLLSRGLQRLLYTCPGCNEYLLKRSFWGKRKIFPLLSWPNYCRHCGVQLTE